MLKASNNHFGDRSKIKIPKNIRAFCNLKNVKITKNVEKYFQHQFWNIRHAQNILKIKSNEIGDQTHILCIYFFVFKECHPHQNPCGINFSTFFSDFCTL